MQLISQDSSDIPEQYLPTIIRHLNGFRNDTLDFSKPYLNPYFANIYPLPVIIYSILIILSTLANFAMIYHIFKYDVHKEPTCAYLVNIAIANVIHVVLALPITLAVLLMHNWIFGKFICYCLPMLQDFGESEQNKHPFRGVQMCIANLSEDIQEYIRSLFIATYIAPLTITAYICVKSGQELQTREGPLAVAVFLSRDNNSTSYLRQGSNASNDVALTIHGKRRRENIDTSYDIDDSELNLQKEKRTQKYLIFMITTFAVCLCPLMILRLARSAVRETYENSRHLDITYVTFVWVAFLPALITPCLYASWQINRRTKERLHDFLCFSNRRHIQTFEDGQPLSNTRSLRPSSLVAQNPRPEEASRSNNSSIRSDRGIASVDAVSDSYVAHSSRPTSQATWSNPDVLAVGCGSCKTGIVSQAQSM
ncbi:PREDICTED: G-protein coupled receptor 54 isoform X2 [Ceratosolen solmsi marchali]|uniref:G-protein coupled receptor 54 isoform X2 n=1 Tax=Ceratosolen solmsi marchali TaxID=326594 RepID=A0AAJ7DXY9_9HYME|nr:PREDICTED: G-protein coupled receptor 54 isoform X2 [Ceratosolen solmsi marchali]